MSLLLFRSEFLSSPAMIREREVQLRSFQRTNPGLKEYMKTER
jgi:hypothetical protein